MDQKDPDFSDLNQRDLIHSIFISQGILFFIGALVLVLSRNPWWDGLNQPVAWYLQLAYGIGAAGLGALVLIPLSLSNSLLREAGKVTEAVMRALNPGPLLIIVISVMAGFFEELLFRAALQPLIGIWLASAAFALAHAPGLFRSKSLWVYLSVIYLAGIWLGVMFERLGLLSAMTAHAVYDGIVISFLMYKINSEENKKDQQE